MASRFKPYLTVALIIEQDNKILMVEELCEKGTMVFGMPAGHVDAKESIIDAAIREGLEETTSEIELTSLVGVYDYVKDYETILRFCFSAKLKNPKKEFVPNDPDGDVLAIKWYSKEEIYQNKDIWRTRLVGLCLDDYYQGKRYPLSLINTLDTTTHEL